jgi:dTMP kinase
MKEGKLIVLVGGDGSGTTSCIKRLKKMLPEEKFFFTYEPKEETIRTFVKSNELSVYEQILGFVLARSIHFRTEVLPELKSGKHVICDRCCESTYAYQIYANDANYNLKVLFSGLDKRARQRRDVDLWINFAVDPEIALKRRKNEGVGTDVFDTKSLEFHSKVREGLDYFLKGLGEDITEPFLYSFTGTAKHVNAELPEENVANEVHRIVTEFIG